MITMNVLGKVRRLHYRDGLSLSDLERRTGLSRNAARKWFKAAPGAAPRYRRAAISGKLLAFREVLVEALHTALCRTLLPFGLAVDFMAAVGAGMAAHAPGTRSIGDREPSRQRGKSITARIPCFAVGDEPGSQRLREAAARLSVGERGRPRLIGPMGDDAGIPTPPTARERPRRRHVFSE